MATTLTTLTVPGSSVTPRNASQVIFDNDYAKLAALPLKQRLVIALLGMIHTTQYNVINYRSSHPQLRQDAKVFLGGLETPLNLWASLAAISWSAGKTVDSSLTADISGLLAEGKVFLEQSEEDLIRQFIFVFISLI